MVGNIRITLAGLEYLRENSIMKKIYNAAKGVKDVTPVCMSSYYNNLTIHKHEPEQSGSFIWRNNGRKRI